MVKLSACVFRDPVGGSWVLKDVTQEIRGSAYEAERDEQRTRVEVWRSDTKARRVVVPMENVAWYVDAPVEEKKK